MSFPFCLGTVPLNNDINLRTMLSMPVFVACPIIVQNEKIFPEKVGGFKKGTYLCVQGGEDSV